MGHRKKYRGWKRGHKLGGEQSGSSLLRYRSDKRCMGFDALVANAGRLNILTALAVEERQEFVQLRQRTALTDGNLACHARRLATAGLIEINKSFRDGKPVTSMTLTTAGRSALEAHARRVLAAISHRRIMIPPPSSAEPAATPTS
jgi:DNA-binding MarR family transcriptional regulator